MEKKINSKLIYEGRVVKLTVDDVLVNNEINAVREVVHHNGGAAILVVVDNKILLVKQFRYAFNKMIYEIPAGKLEKNEDPLVSAKRELEEETGYIANNMISLGEIYPTVGFCNEVINLYLTTDIKKGSLNLDYDEFIEIEFVDINKVNEMIVNNVINDSKTICALYKYNLLKEE